MRAFGWTWLGCFKSPNGRIFFQRWGIRMNTKCWWSDKAMMWGAYSSRWGTKVYAIMPHLRTLNITSEFSWGIYFFLDFDISCPSLHCEQDKDRPSTTQFSVRGMTPYAMPILHAWEATLYLLNGCPIRGEMTKIAYPPPVKVSRVEISVVDTVIHGRENEIVMLQSAKCGVFMLCDTWSSM